MVAGLIDCWLVVCLCCVVAILLRRTNLQMFANRRASGRFQLKTANRQTYDITIVYVRHQKEENT